MGTTFNLPNFVGDLFSISPESTPFLSAIGDLTGGRAASDKEFGWQYFDLRDPDDTRQRVEGDDAPTATGRVRSEVKNVVEIHQESISISYTDLAKVAAGGASTALRGPQIADELRWQMDQQLKEVARDVNQSFITGTYANPGNNATARKTRGIIQAVATNVKDMAGTQPTEDDVLDLFQVIYNNGAEPGLMTALVGSAFKRYLTKLFITDKSAEPLSRNIGGVNLTQFQTDFGTINVMMDRGVPTGTLLALDLSVIAPRFLEVPGKGHFFYEPLAKTGAREEAQLYGEIGLEYGNEKLHGKIVDATTPYDGVGLGSGS